MTSMRPWSLLALLPLLALGTCATAPTGKLRMFPDRPVAWFEHDEGDVPRIPKALELEEEKAGTLVRDFFTREADRVLSLEPTRAALDVNALDEVPCSTWFCPRRHLFPMTEDALLAGPPDSAAPRLPFSITEGKAEGVAAGFIGEDVTGRKFLVKFDPPGHAGLASGAEVVGNLFLHAAGYNVPGAFVVDLERSDIRLQPHARLKLSGVARRPFTEAALAEMLAKAALTDTGRMRAVAVPWIGGKVLGGFDTLGRRKDDPNDRIPHQDRRSLRATRILFGWLNITDPGVQNNLDSYVEEDGRRFLRHYLLDFGTGLGAGTVRIKSVPEGREHDIELARMLAATASLGAYQRDWQKDVTVWRIGSTFMPDIGWLYPSDTWRPDAWRPGPKLPMHVRMTERDGYWAAKLVTSFTDAEIHAVVTAAGYGQISGPFLENVLRARRDRIGDRYLLAYAAVELPALSADGANLCFDDLALARGYAPIGGTRYRIRVTRDAGPALRQWEETARGPRHCVSVLPDAGAPYLVISIETLIAGRASRPTAVHLRWRPAERRFVVVGIDRAD